MKKYITILLLLLLMPAIVFAQPAYTSETLEDALKSEKIKYDLKDYKESDDKVNVYLFRGAGCSHCYEFLEYVSSKLIDEMGDKFNVVVYEVWNDKDNAKLMEKVGQALGEDASGVPFIVIGDKSFSGYAESMNDDIKEAINKLYDSEEKYDIFDNLDIDKNEEKKPEKKDNTTMIILTVASCVIIAALVVFTVKKK